MANGTEQVVDDKDVRQNVNEPSYGTEAPPQVAPPMQLAQARTAPKEYTDSVDAYNKKQPAQGGASGHSVEDVFNMVQKKFGIDFASDPYETVNRNLESTLTEGFKKVFPGKTIADMGSLSHKEMAHWEKIVDKVRAHLEKQETYKRTSAYHYLTTASSLYEKDLHNQIKALEMENKQMKAGKANKTTYQATRDSLKERGIKPTDTNILAEMKKEKIATRKAGQKPSDYKESQVTINGETRVVLFKNGKYYDPADHTKDITDQVVKKAGVKGDKRNIAAELGLEGDKGQGQKLTAKHDKTGKIITSDDNGRTWKDEQGNVIKK